MDLCHLFIIYLLGLLDKDGYEIVKVLVIRWTNKLGHSLKHACVGSHVCACVSVSHGMVVWFYVLLIRFINYLLL